MDGYYFTSAYSDDGGTTWVDVNEYQITEPVTLGKYSNDLNSDGIDTKYISEGDIVLRVIGSSITKAWIKNITVQT